MNPEENHPIDDNEEKPVIERLEEENARRRAERKRWLAQLILRFRLFFYDRIVRQATQVLDESQRIEKRRAELADENTAQERALALRRSRQCALWVLFAIFVAASADVFCVLPNIAFALAARFAGGEDPSALQKLCAYLVLEIAIVVLLFSVKGLAATRPHLEERNRSRQTPAYRAAVMRLWGARTARVAYVVLISGAFGLNIWAEIGKAMQTREMLKTIRSTVTTRDGKVVRRELEKENIPVLVAAQPGSAERPTSEPLVIPITAGVSILIWALHIAILFLPSGEFGRRGIGEFTRAELEGIERANSRQRHRALLRLNGKLKSANNREERHRAMLDRTPAVVVAELDKMMGGASAASRSAAAARAPGVPAQPLVAGSAANGSGSSLTTEKAPLAVAWPQTLQIVSGADAVSLLGDLDYPQSANGTR